MCIGMKRRHQILKRERFNIRYLVRSVTPYSKANTARETNKSYSNVWKYMTVTMQTTK